MAELSLTINNRGYTVSCDDGQEAHLTNLAAHLDQLVQDLVSQVGQVGEARLLVMASLMVADELAEAYDRIAELERGHDAPPPAAGNGALEAEVAQAMESCASRLEAIAARLEGS